MYAKYNEQNKAVMDELLIPLSGVSATRMFGYPAYTANGKAFLYVVGSAIAIKLPPERVKTLKAAGAKAFNPGKSSWKDWVLVEHAEAAAYREDFALFEEAAQFAAG